MRRRTLAEGVTLRGNYERRPDLVLYIKGIAVAVIELKCSHVSIGYPRGTNGRRMVARTHWSELAMSYTEEEKQRILAEAHGQLERLRHFEPSERSNIIPLRRQRQPDPPPPRMFNDSRIQSLIDAAIETTRAKLDEYREYVSGLLVELLAQFRDELLERYVAEDISKLTGQMKPLVDQIGT